MRKKKNSDRMVVGTIRVSLRGKGFIRTEDKQDDIEIDFNSLNTALNGDTVKVSFKKKKDKYFGEVKEVIKRAKRGFAGQIIKKNKEFFLKPTDPRAYLSIKIDKEDLGTAKEGDKAFVKIRKWSKKHGEAFGKVEEVLGRSGEHEAEMRGIILERGFDSTFPDEVEAEAQKLKEKKITESEIKNRRDLRDTTTFTIDPYDAKDFDDALSFKKLPNGNFEIGVHIADVSYYLRPNTVLDKEALERATSVYLVDRTIPMLPEVLSNDLCSLNPKEDKLTFSAIFEMDKNGNIKKEWFGRTIINSDKRFTYEEAQEILNKGAGLFYEELNIINEIAKKLTKERVKSGAIVMETEEIKFKLDENGKPIDVFVKERGDTNKLIEEFMLLANKRVSMFGAKDKSKKDRVFIYRIHDEPDKNKIRDLKEYLKLLGYSLNERRGVVPPEEFNRLFRELEGKEEKDTIQSHIVRSMQKAIYSTKNIGHYGLAFPFYTHFTSPIRRYPDVIAHRLLDSYLKGEIVPKEKAGFYEKLAEHCTEREIEAAEAERASIKYKQIEYMADRVGQEFDGIVTSITEWGLYVAEKKSRAEGLIRVRDLDNFGYSYDVKKLMLVSKNSSKMIRIGDTIRIKLLKVDTEDQIIDYELIED